MNEVQITEASIQAALFKELVEKGHSHIAPNCMAIGNEADLLSITSSGYLYEYEIKISKQDFRDDQNKKNKHYRYQNATEYKERGWKKQEHIPSCFYYVVPAGMVSIEEMPTHAGLIEITPMLKRIGPKRKPVQYLAVIITKKPPRLHSEKAGEVTKHKITTSLMWKVFNKVVKE